MMSNNFLEWGRQARAKRRQLEISQEELASRIGCTRQTIANLEKGRHSPSSEVIAGLVRELGLRWPGQDSAA